MKQNAHFGASHVGFALIHVVGLSKEVLTAGERMLQKPCLCHIHRRSKTHIAAGRLGSNHKLHACDCMEVSSKNHGILA